MTQRNILLLGKNGQLGCELLQTLGALGSVQAHDRRSCDVTNAAQLRDIIRAASPDLIVNAAAYTAIEAAEDDEGACYAANTDAPKLIAQEAARLGAVFVHYSSDYVFDGRKWDLYRETDAANPLNVYGKSKLAGERAALSAHDKTIVFRVGWVYGRSGRNFAKTILRLAQEKKELAVVDDQIGTPTSTGTIAEATMEFVQALDRTTERSARDLFGVFHLAARGAVHRYDYARILLEHAKASGFRLKADCDQIVAVNSADMKLKAARPANSALNTDKLRAAIGIKLPKWQDDLRNFVTGLRAAA
jgi:dTDP-4-dehydrorhamnose reductase